MIRESVSSLGYSLTKEHPATVEEYNQLAPNRPDACRQDAVASTDYRSVFPIFRDSLLTELGAANGVERINNGTEEEPKWETEGKWFLRIVAKSGKSREDFIASTADVAQRHMDAAAFDPSERERKSDGPAIGKKDLAMAQDLIKRGAGKVAEVAAQLGRKLGREVATDEKSLARAFADYRRAKAAELEAAQKAEFGMS